MSLWFRQHSQLDQATMREIANNADVSWDAQSIIFRADGIGFANGEPADATAIQDAAENLINYRPQEIDAPPEPTVE